MEPCTVTVNVESLVCEGCLSYDRHCSSIEDNADLYYRILDPLYPFKGASSISPTLCWECEAILRRVRQFQNKVQKAQAYLHNVSAGQTERESLSSLTSTTKDSYELIITEEKQKKDRSTDFSDTDTANTNASKNIQNAKDKSNKTDSYKIDRNNGEMEKKINFKDPLKIKIEIIEEPVDEEAKDANLTDDGGVDNLEDMDTALDARSSTDDTETQSDSEDDKNDSDWEIPIKKEKDREHTKKETRGRTESSVTLKKRGERSRKKLMEVHNRDLYMLKEDLTGETFLVYILSPDLKLLVCHVCQMTFETADQLQLLKEHLINGHGLTVKAGVGPENKPFLMCKAGDAPTTCKPCGLSFTELNDYKEHLKSEHKDTASDDRHNCERCDASFSYKFQLRAHVAEKHSNKSFPCHLCPKVLTSRPYLEGHIRHIHEKIPRIRRKVCDTCGKKFKTIGKLKEHKRKEHKRSRSLQCDYCPAAFSLAAGRLRHMKRMHPKVNIKSEVVQDDTKPGSTNTNSTCDSDTPNFENVQMLCKTELKVDGDGDKDSGDEKKVVMKSEVTDPVEQKKMHKNNQCHVCMKVLGSRATLRRHILGIHKKVPKMRNKICQTCGKGFSTNRHLIHHIRTHTGERPYQCKFCPARFTQKCTEQKHARRVHPDLWKREGMKPEMKYACAECDRRFYHKINLAMHIEKAHVPKVFQCHICPKTLSSAETLRQHILRVHDKVPRPKKKVCETCGKSFTNNHYLTQHVRTHTGERPFDCDLCPARFSQKSGIYIHMKLKHPAPNADGEMDPGYICDYCNLRFQRKPNLRMHIEVKHLNITHQCHICAKLLSTTNTLRQHILRVHEKAPKPKNKVCETCGKSFSFNRNLREHMRTHTGERPYPCKYCSMIFRQKTSRQKHMKRLHPEYTQMINSLAAARLNNLSEARINSITGGTLNSLNDARINLPDSRINLPDSRISLNDSRMNQLGDSNSLGMPMQSLTAQVNESQVNSCMGVYDLASIRQKGPYGRFGSRDE